MDFMQAIKWPYQRENWMNALFIPGALFLVYNLLNIPMSWLGTLIMMPFMVIGESMGSPIVGSVLGFAAYYVVSLIPQLLVVPVYGYLWELMSVFREEGYDAEAHYEYVVQTYGDPSEVLSKYDTLFVDSITVAGRLCFTYCTNQPECKSDRTGKLDTRAAYGMQGREMMGWLSHLQHIRDKNVIFVGILDERVDDYGRQIYELQIEGSKTGRELPGIVDEVITMAVMSDDNGSPYRAFVCQTLNQWGYPAKDRSGRLDLLEEPHLGRLLEKMSGGEPQAERPMNFVNPNEVEDETNA